MTTGERIKAARIKAGLKQSELAEKLGVAVITIGQYERDKRQPRLKQLEKIAFALETTVSEFVEPDYWSKVSKAEIDEAWEASTPFYVDPEVRIANAIALMSKEGKNKVADYAMDILPSYCTQSTSKSPVPREGKDTTPPADAPETAPEGE